MSATILKSNEILNESSIDHFRRIWLFLLDEMRAVQHKISYSSDMQMSAECLSSSGMRCPLRKPTQMGPLPHPFMPSLTYEQTRRGP